MTAHDPERDVDELLGKDGGEIGHLYRRLPRYEPPRRLDRTVLSEAARAVHSGKPPRRQRWIVGVGSAAGLVLAAGIAWRIGHDAMSPSDNAASMKQVVPVQPITEPLRAKRDAPEPSAAPAESDAAQEAEPRSENGSSVRHRAAKDEVAPAAAKAKAPRQSASAKSVAPMAAPAEPPKPIPVEPAAAPPPQAFPAAPEQRERAEILEKSSGKSAAAAGGVAADAGDATNDKQAEPSTARGLSSPTSINGSVELRRDTQLAPEDWLSHIRELRRQGRTQQASESLRLFARAHPDWTIPDELQPLLK